jgi:carbon-monoxide dehydrogenase iron sulfur subunit
MSRAVVADLERCVGCRSCELACAVAHSRAKQLMAALAETPPPRPAVKVVAVGELAVPVQCRHCPDPPCVAVCPTGALAKADPQGPVTFQADLCRGCKLCLIACPYGVIGLSADEKKIAKCDLCVARLAAGEPPACVAACPTGALGLGEVEPLPEARPPLAPAPAASVGEGSERLATCLRCGAPVGPKGAVKAVATKLGVQVEELLLCPACRRSWYARSLAQARPAAGAHP